MANQDSSDVQQKHEQTVADYVGDMVALESHIEEAFDRQLTEARTTRRRPPRCGASTTPSRSTGTR